MEKTFTVPSGYVYTIREQNGNDDDILSSKVDLDKLMNISNFISAIVVKTDATTTGRLTPEEAFHLPVLDRSVILIQSRILSLGEELEFDFSWDGKEQTDYSQNLNDLIFNYSETATKEMIASKPEAVPYYPLLNKFKDIPINTTSGKSLLFDILTNDKEVEYINLPLSQQTKNQKLIVRNLRMKVDEAFIKVNNFELFSVKDMVEINKAVKAFDPTFNAAVTISNPNNPIQKVPINIFSLDSFFYLEEI